MLVEFIVSLLEHVLEKLLGNRVWIYVLLLLLCAGVVACSIYCD